MQKENNESLQFENKVRLVFNFLFERFLKHKLTGKEFAIRLITLLVAGFAISGLMASMLMPTLTNMTSMSSFTLQSLSAFSYVISSLLLLWSVISVLITMILIIKRINDIVPDSSIWPYAAVAILLSFVPLIGYALFVLLALLPSNYLSAQKRQELLSKVS